MQFAEKSLQKQLSGTTKTSIVAIIWSQGIKFYKQAEYIESLEWLKIALSTFLYRLQGESRQRESFEGHPEQLLSAWRIQSSYFHSFANGS